MSTAELNEQDAQTDMRAYAEQVVREVEAERKGEEPEQKSDAQIISETAKPAHDETPVETDSDSDTALEGEDTVEVDDRDEEPEGEEWLTDDLKAEASAFGISESDIADFASREELERALRLFDKSALEAGRKALAETEDPEEGKGPARDKDGRFAKKEEPKADPPAMEGRYEFKTDVYDEDLEADLKGFRDHYDSRLAELEEYGSRLAEMEERLRASEDRFAAADAIARERLFDNLVDSLGHEDLFGKTDQETEQEKQRREDLLVEVETYLKGREVLGRPAEMNETIVNRIARSLFADELGRKELKKRTRKIAQQSNGRQGGGATRPQDPREDPREEADRLYREMERSK